MAHSISNVPRPNWTTNTLSVTTELRGTFWDQSALQWRKRVIWVQVTAEEKRKIGLICIAVAGVEQACQRWQRHSMYCLARFLMAITRAVHTASLRVRRFPARKDIFFKMGTGNVMSWNSISALRSGQHSSNQRVVLALSDSGQVKMLQIQKRQWYKEQSGEQQTPPVWVWGKGGHRLVW